MKTGVVIKSTGSFYTVVTENGCECVCGIRGKLRTEGFRTTNPLAVGDIVDLDDSVSPNVITQIHKRRNYLIRKSTNLSKESHIIAANVDQVMIIVTLAFPETSTVFIDRLLATAEAYRIRPLLVFNKIDIYPPEEMEAVNALADVYRRIDYPCFFTSAITGIGVEEVRQALTGETTVIAGLSGVGKSSLINGIEPSLGLKTASISLSHLTGKHTTTFAEMFPLSGGGYIIDTPGIRSFGVIDMEKEEMSHFFPEIFAFSSHCKYGNCSHTHEPGCAVTAALQDGEIAESRYLSYLSMLEDEGGKYR
ncbi:MAG: ribosome small subunit-dependent GTPase A [Culturomica sp.]|jgi:ribosome biogenesis GTPase|nr:ribosome small subunit-dependent GTPase A [Culturomica sp.]